MNEDSRILVVEDDPDGRVVVSHILKSLNFPVDVAADAEEAAEYIFNSGITYRAFIIDLALPGKDGWELLAEILDEPRVADVPCIAVTAFHTSKTREEALRAGFTAYFAKPLEAMSFAREVTSLI
jgi:two-component system cell cycle response regulator